MQIRAREIYALDDVGDLAERYGRALTSGLTIADVAGLARGVAGGHARGRDAGRRAGARHAASVTGWLMPEGGEGEAMKRFATALLFVLVAALPARAEIDIQTLTSPGGLQGLAGRGAFDSLRRAGDPLSRRHLARRAGQARGGQPDDRAARGRRRRDGRARLRDGPRGARRRLPVRCRAMTAFRSRPQVLTENRDEAMALLRAALIDPAVRRRRDRAGARPGAVASQEPGDRPERARSRRVQRDGLRRPPLRQL